MFYNFKVNAGGGFRGVCVCVEHCCRCGKAGAQVDACHSRGERRARRTLFRAANIRKIRVAKFPRRTNFPLAFASFLSVTTYRQYRRASFVFEIRVRHRFSARLCVEKPPTASSGDHLPGSYDFNLRLLHGFTVEFCIRRFVAGEYGRRNILTFFYIAVKLYFPV